MPRLCSVCTHPNRGEIDRALVADGSLRGVAGQHGLNDSSVARHKADHLPAAMVQGEEAKAEARALDVVQQLKAINQASLTVLRDARAAGDGELVLKAVDRVVRQIELQAKLLGELDDRPVVNILVSPEWLAVRGRILGALQAHPQARVAVIEALGDAG